MKCKVLFNFEAKDKDEISVTKSEILEIVQQDTGDGWLIAKNDKNKTGLVPLTYISIIKEVKKVKNNKETKQETKNRNSVQIIKTIVSHKKKNKKESSESNIIKESKNVKKSIDLQSCESKNSSDDTEINETEESRKTKIDRKHTKHKSIKNRKMSRVQSLEILVSSDSQESVYSCEDYPTVDRKQINGKTDKEDDVSSYGKDSDTETESNYSISDKKNKLINWEAQNKINFTISKSKMSTNVVRKQSFIFILCSNFSDN
ncbi:hypothetical protein A3Q56_06948, partial [Intoshia linei]